MILFFISAFTVALISPLTNSTITCLNNKILHTAALIQYLMHCKSAKKCLVNWKICAVNPPTSTFPEFLSKRLACQTDVFVGKSKEDHTSEVDHNLLDVSHCFGQYIKF